LLAILSIILFIGFNNKKIDKELLKNIGIAKGIPAIK
jgi:hypothetical protein